VGPGWRKGLRTDLGGGPGRNLITFGLWPGSDSAPTQRQLLAVGAIDDHVNPAGFNASPPFAPITHALAPDGYWAAKRIARISLRDVVAAVHEARMLDPTARTYLLRTLIKRTQAIVAYWYSQVSPCELKRVSHNVLVMRDEAVARAVTQVSDTHYAVEVLDDRGNVLTDVTRFQLPSAQFAVLIPPELASGRDRLVVRLQAKTRGKPRPRPCYVHVVPSAHGLRVIGIRH
jgi:hypothetical protein